MLEGASRLAAGLYMYECDSGVLVRVLGSVSRSAVGLERSRIVCVSLSVLAVLAVWLSAYLAV